MAEEKKENPRYKGIKKEIADELQQDEILYFREDKPIPFCGLTIYPIQVRDYELFCSCSACLTLNRKETAAGIVMTDLEFLLSKLKDKKEGADWSFKIQKLLELIFHIDNGFKCQNKKCNTVISYTSKEFLQYVGEVQKAAENKETPPPLICPKCGGKEFVEMIGVVQDQTTKKHNLVVDGHVITPKDFSRLRQIVMFQNIPDYHDDSWVDPELRKDYEAKLELQRKKNNYSAPLERKVIAIAMHTGYKFEEIYDMPIRKFTQMLSMIDDLIDYKITKSASMSGFVSFPKDFKIEHWLYKPEKDMYGDAYQSLDDLKAKTSNL